MGDITCQNLEVYRKTSKVYELRFTIHHAPFSIEGYTIYFTAKTSLKDSDANAIIQKIVTSHFDTEGGKSLIELSVTDTDIPAGSYFYDVKFVDSNNQAGILFHGRLTIKEPVTQSV